MASNKMLIDASHPEETRVVVLRGNRIEEFDFESQNKRQLKGNIYLAKVTRVEPSLQAAFVDYGGNRHGFLAFNEIHPDYYQIPVADRQALLDEEAEDARRSKAEDDADVETPEKDQVENNGESQTDEEPDTDSEDENTTKEVKAETKPKRSKRRPRRKTAVSKASDDEPPAEENTAGQAEQSETAEQDSKDKDDGDSDPKSIAAMMETDSISEPAADEEPSDEEESQSEDSQQEETPPKKRARSTRRPRKKAKAKAEPEATNEIKEKPDVATADAAEQDAKSEELETSDDGDQPEAVAEEETEKESKPKPRKRRRASRSRSSKKDSESKTGNDEETSDDNGNKVETSGQEDAMEEVPPRRRPRRQYKIQEVIKRRQVLLVQVVKEERGNKGAALTTYLSLAGRYSVLMPNTARGGGISRKITNAVDRKRLKAIANNLEVPEGMGVILRTAGASRDNAEIERDFDYLMRLWKNVRSLTLSSSAPCLVYEEGSLIKRSIRDLYDKNTGEVLVAGTEGYKEAQDFMEMLMPSHTDKVKLYQDEQAMFARFGVETQLDKMLSQQVTLKSGGYLVIDQTEALVAIDVNSGRATREHSIENTALQTNLETAEEVARQLRLRDLAGLIVIDFIDMEENRNNRAVEKKLKECLKHDRARIQVGRISHFGLLEMSRQRMRASVLESTMDVCPHCEGKGHLRSDSSVGLHILRSIEEHLLKNSRFDLVVKASTETTLYILNHKRPALMEIEERFGLKIFIEGSPELLGENFTIEKGEASSGERKPVAHVQVGQTSDATDADSGETSEQPAKRKRRRRRGKANNEENQEAKAEEAQVSDQNLDDPKDQSEEEKPTRRKRTRGKRGGRGAKKPNDEQNPESSKSEESVEATSEIASSNDAAKSEEEAPSPSSRNSRPRKKKQVTSKQPANEVDAPESATAATESEDKPKNPEPPRPKRRVTKRAAAANVSGEEVAQADESSSGDTGKKRGGWWSRTGFFK